MSDFDSTLTSGMQISQYVKDVILRILSQGIKVGLAAGRRLSSGRAIMVANSLNMNFYNQETPHQPLDYKTPAEVYFAIDNQKRESSRYLKEANFMS